jgi:hypothetical protein
MFQRKIWCLKVRHAAKLHGWFGFKNGKIRNACHPVTVT